VASTTDVDAKWLCTCVGLLFTFNENMAETVKLFYPCHNERGFL